MSIQIIGLRDYFDKKENKIKKKESFFDKNWRAPSVKELFSNLDTYLSVIPEEEKYNLYYTASVCLEKRGRVLEIQHVIPFDIDGIDVDKTEEYVTVVLATLGLDRDKTGIVFSGNGLQFLVGISIPIESEEYFDDHRHHYRAICGNINFRMFQEGLIGSADTSVFSAARLLRLPGTKNIKPAKGEKIARLMQPNIEHVAFDLKDISGMPEVSYDQQISDKMLDRLPPPDTKGVLAGCDFIKHCKDKPAEIDEPQWYALLSIIGRLEEAHSLVHEYSEGHPQYSKHETDRKFQQSLKASGPRTCDNISLIFDGCPACPNFGKCKSPIVLQSAEYIKTKDTGFYTIKLTENGPKKSKPHYDDLMRFFEQETPFTNMEEGNVTYTFTGTHWEDFSSKKIDSFAEKHFDPKPSNTICNEFRGKLQRNNLRNAEWYKSKGFINFTNGYLDLDRMELHKHSDDQGFRYVLPFDYDPSETCPRFEQFLREVTRSDEGTIRVLLEFMGYSLSGIDPAIGQKALVLVGGGSNGKSVFMDLLKYLAGKGNYSTLSMGSEINKLENRYQLDGKLFNISEETPNNAMMDSTVFKALVTGGEVQARKLYCDAYSMRNTAKIIMACNELPDTKDLSHGMFRRLLLVPFKQKFDETIKGYDPMLRDKLYDEAPGIVNMALAALAGFKETQGFTSSETITNEVDAYRRSNDDILTWYEDSVFHTGTKTDTLYLDDLYSLYKMDAEMGGIRAKTKYKFNQQLRGLAGEHGISRRRDKKNKLKYCMVGYTTEDTRGEF